MRLFIDRTDRWQEIAVLDDTGDTRTYYLALLPHLALMVLRNGLKLGHLRNMVVDAEVGWDRGDVGFSRIPGRQQSKITVFRLDRSIYWDQRLVEVLRKAPRG